MLNAPASGVANRSSRATAPAGTMPSRLLRVSRRCPCTRAFTGGVPPAVGVVESAREGILPGISAASATPYPVAMPANGDYRVGVVGATGAVGSTILEVLAERKFPAAELIPLASARSAGSKVPFAGGELEVRELTE